MARVNIVAGAGTGGDDTNAIQAAIDAAASTLGVVFLDYPTAGFYSISSGLEIPTGVSFCSISGMVTIKALNSMGYMVQLEGASATGNRYGLCEGITLDGNSLAQRGWDIALAVQRDFRRIRGINTTVAGGVLRGTQNCTFTRCDFEDNGAASNDNGGGLRINHGAGNNLFLNCEFSQNRYHQIVFADSASLDDDTAYPSGTFTSPHGNIFVDCIIERVQTQTTHQVRFRTGLANEFLRCDIQSTGARNLVYIDNEDTAAADPGQNTFRDCYFNGTSGGSGSTMFYIQHDFKTRVINPFAENHRYAFQVDDNSTVLLEGGAQFSTITTFYNALGSDARETHLRISGQAARGTGTINSGSTSATITHGLPYTPASREILINLLENPTSDPGNIWVDTIGATTFQVNCRNNPGASNLDFAWAVL